MSLELTVEFPTTPETGEKFNVEATLEWTDILSHQSTDDLADAVVRFKIDDTVIDEYDFDWNVSEDESLNFEYVLHETGEYDFTVEAEVTFVGVTEKEDETYEVEVIAAGQVLDGATGAALTAPDELDSVLDEYAEEYYIDEELDDRYAFTFADEGHIYLVFTSESPTAGEATISGAQLANELVTESATYGVVFASDASFTTDGNPVSIDDLAGDPDGYAFSLVDVSAYHQRGSVLFNSFASPTHSRATLGVLTEEKSSALFEEPGERGREITLYATPDDGNLGGQIRDHLEEIEPWVLTVNLQEHYWTTGPMTVTGLVLPSGSDAREFVDRYDATNVTDPDDGLAVLYALDQEFEYDSYDSVAELKATAEDGDIVQLETNSLVLNVSTQETLLATTGTEVPFDVHLQAAACWTTLPEDSDDLLFAGGLSSRNLDIPVEPDAGTYTFIGEVVVASRFDGALPDEPMLLIYEIVEEVDLDFDDLPADAQEAIEKKRARVTGAIQRQIQSLPRALGAAELIELDARIQQSRPHVDEMVAYVGGLGEDVTAIDLPTGETDWTFSREGALVGSAPVLDEETLVIGSGAGTIYGIDIVDKEADWTVETESAIASTPALDDGDVYVANNGGVVYKINVAQGTVEWTTETEEPIYSQPAVGDEVVIVTTNEGSVIALNKTESELKWSNEYPVAFDIISPATDGDAVYVGTDAVIALDADNGAQEWSEDIPGSVSDTPVVDSGEIFVGTDADSVVALTTAGEVEWETSMDGSGRTVVSVSDQLVVAVSDQTLTVLDRLTGSPITTVSVPGDAFVAPEIGEERVVIPTADEVNIRPFEQ